MLPSLKAPPGGLGELKLTASEGQRNKNYVYNRSRYITLKCYRPPVCLPNKQVAVTMKDNKPHKIDVDPLGPCANSYNYTYHSKLYT